VTEVLEENDHRANIDTRVIKNVAAHAYGGTHNDSVAKCTSELSYRTQLLLIL